MEMQIIQDKLKRTIARVMELLELANASKLKDPVKRELWFFYKNLEKEYGINGEAKDEQNYNR